MTTVNPSELFDSLVPCGFSYDKIAHMDLDLLTECVQPRLDHKRAYAELTAREIAVLVQGWARCQAIEEVVRQFLAKNATYKDLREIIKGGA